MCAIHKSIIGGQFYSIPRDKGLNINPSYNISFSPVEGFRRSLSGVRLKTGK